MIENLDWFESAPCKGKTDLFFGNQNENIKEKRLRERKAKTICFSCPNIHECRDYARRHREYGIWGAETENQRLSNGYYPPRFRVRTRKINNK